MAGRLDRGRGIIFDYGAPFDDDLTHKIARNSSDCFDSFVLTCCAVSIIRTLSLSLSLSPPSSMHFIASTLL